ncbi:MAG: OmpA family protein [Crocinitomicaceae bacterium]|nr:OmpA family protein [Crocinitomicaceae bacterium]
MNILKSLLLLVAFPFIGFSQMTELEVREMTLTASEQELVFECSQMMQQNFLFHAEIVVDKLLTYNPQSANYNYRKGYIVLKSRRDQKTAIPYLKVAITDVDKNYDLYSHKEKSAAIDAYYHLGTCYHLDENLTEAVKYYQMFLENSSKKSGLVELAKLNIVQCGVARQLIANPKSAIVKNIGKEVNTANPEYAPVVSLDGTSLYFTSRRVWDDKSSDDFRDPMLNNHPEDIYVSYQDFEGAWTSPEKLAFCNNETNEATIAVSSDERKIFVYQDATGGGDIYYSNFGGNKFEQLEKLEYNDVNSDSWETHCTVTPDGENVYFVSDRDGGYGGRDIYRIVKLPNGEWSKAQNMGPEINTPYDEDSPFIAVNNKTLYYSSNGPKSMGGFDVFVSFRDEDNNWSTPLNMGYPINSTGDDIFYTTTVDGLRGYLSSFRKDGYGEKDIYEIQNDYLGNSPISSLVGIIATTDGSALPDNITVKLECPSCNKDEDKLSEPRIKKGRYFSLLQRCKEYTLSFYEGEKLLKTEAFNTKCNSENEEIQKNCYIGRYTLSGTIADVETTELLPDAKVEFINPEDGSVIETFTTDSNGAFTSDFLDEAEYNDEIRFDVKVTKDNYLTQTFVVDEVLGMKSNLSLDYLITKSDVGVDIGAVFELNPIYFDVNKSDIRPDAALELDKIVQIMNENPSIKIELGSHTDCRASKSYNLSLSKRRAKSSAAYIKSRIDNPKRIYGKGYGESKLVNDCGCEGKIVSDCSEEEHQANRRTEFMIVKN